MLRNQGRDHILHFVPTQEVSWRGGVGVRLADTTGLSSPLHTRIHMLPQQQLWPLPETTNIS